MRNGHGHCNFVYLHFGLRHTIGATWNFGNVERTEVRGDNNPSKEIFGQPNIKNLFQYTHNMLTVCLQGQAWHFKLSSTGVLLAT